MSFNYNTNVSGAGSRIFSTHINTDMGWECGNDKERTITITLGEYEDMKRAIKRFREFRGLVDELVLALKDSQIAKDAEVIKALSFVTNY